MWPITVRFQGYYFPSSMPRARNIGEQARRRQVFSRTGQPLMRLLCATNTSCWPLALIESGHKPELVDTQQLTDAERPAGIACARHGSRRVCVSRDSEKQTRLVMRIRKREMPGNRDVKRPCRLRGRRWVRTCGHRWQSPTQSTCRWPTLRKFIYRHALRLVRVRSSRSAENTGGDIQHESGHALCEGRRWRDFSGAIKLPGRQSSGLEFLSRRQLHWRQLA